MTTLNESVHWSAELGGGTRVALIQAGRFRTDAGAILGVVPRMLWNKLVVEEIDADHRLLQALNCLLGGDGLRASPDRDRDRRPHR